MTAHAAGGAASENDTGLVVVLVIGVALMYLAAHFVVDRLQRTLLIVAGLEYILLGGLLGPAVPQIRVLEDLTGLMPVIALAAGWVGLLRGTELDVRALKQRKAYKNRVVFLHHMVPGLLVAAASWYALRFGLLGRLSWRECAITSAVLGCCAAADSVTPVDMLARRYQIDGEVAPTLRHAARLGDVLVIFVFGVVFCLLHLGLGAGLDSASPMARPTEWEWVLISLALGAGLGFLFPPFLGGDPSPNARFLALVGIIVFASGASYFLALPPLAVNLTLGAVLVNVARTGGAIRHALSSTERPMTLVLLVLAGALWRPSNVPITVAGIAAFVGLRFLGKLFASRLAAFGTELRPDLYRGLLAHGEVTVAMAVSYRLVYQGPSVDIAYSVVLVSVVLHDLLSPRLLRSLLVDAGELTRELAPSPTSSSWPAGGAR